MTHSLRPGSILELDADDGCIHCVFLGRHPKYGDCIRVGARIVPFGTSPEEKDWKQSYALFYPASQAIKAGIAKVVGISDERHLPEAILRRSPSLRGPPKGWILEQNDGHRLQIRNLTVDHLRFPLVMLVNHAYLVSRVRTGWNPLDSGSPVDQPTRPDEVRAGLLGGRATSHYIYYFTRGSADAAVPSFRSAGFATVMKPAATGDRPWMLLVTNASSESPGGDCRTSDVRAIATMTGGEYDGYERPAG